jgi:hypothetical protein
MNSSTMSRASPRNTGADARPPTFTTLVEPACLAGMSWDRIGSQGDPVAEETPLRSDDAYESLLGIQAGRVPRLPGLDHLGARLAPGRAGRPGVGAGQVRALDPDGGDGHDEGEEHDPC